MFADPPRTDWDVHFSVLGIPVRIHPFFWLVAVIFGIRGEPQLLDLFAWMAALFVSILIHEMGHALAMRAYGFTPWITLYGFGGLASYGPASAYGSKRLSPIAQVLISAAGPGAGFALAALILGAVAAIMQSVAIGLGGRFGLQIAIGTVGSATFSSFLFYVLFICIFWGCINLLPIYPLDGGQIAREIFLKFTPRNGIRYSLFLSMITAVALASVGLLHLNSLFMAVFFGYMAYSNYVMLQFYQNRRPW